MSEAKRYDTLTATDGTGVFEAYCATPPGGRGPGILLFQEIFGINDNMRQLADRLAAQGYVVLVPDMFWRIQPRFERKDESGFGDAIAIAQQFDLDLGAQDIQAAHAYLLAMAECTGKVGAMGFCLGGGLAYVAATRSRVDGKGPDAVVPYYGSIINDLLGEVDSLTCPALFHYGDNDPFIASDKIDEVERAVATKPAVEFYRYAAGHAFSNGDAPTMYDAAAAELAWGRTLDFLGRYLR